MRRPIGEDLSAVFVDGGSAVVTGIVQCLIRSLMVVAAGRALALAISRVSRKSGYGANCQ